MEMIAFDSHKHYTLSRVVSEAGSVLACTRIPHLRGEISKFLERFTPGSTVAVEAIGNWYWIVDEIEGAAMRPALVHPRKAKLMMGMINKTDKLDVQGLNLLQQNGTLPEVWIPPAEVRDRRELTRSRMTLVTIQTSLKNRVHAALAKYALHEFEASDIFGKRNRPVLLARCEELPPETRFTTLGLLEEIGSLQEKIAAIEERMEAVFEKTPEVELLMTLPGVGFLLATVIVNEMGDITRFPGADRFTAYAGTTPRIKASGGKVRFGRLRSDTNRYLKWAFIEAANVICLHRRRHPDRHLTRLYERILAKKGHSVAIGAVARQLAESAYWVIRKKVTYREPSQRQVSQKEA